MALSAGATSRNVLLSVADKYGMDSNPRCNFTKPGESQMGAPVITAINWSAEKKAGLQALVENLQANWPTDRDYMAPPTRGKRVALDPALLVKPPKGLEVGDVPIVTRQAAQ